MDAQEILNILTEKLSTWMQNSVAALPNLALAVLVIWLGIFISKKIRNIVSILLKKYDYHSTLTTVMVSAIYIAGVSVTIFIALSILNLDKAVTSLLAGAGIIGLALAFAFQDIATNFMSGIFISLRKPIHVGDLVKIDGYQGRVKKVNLRDTVIQTVQGELVIIPNKIVFQNPIENFTLLGKRRFDLEVGVSYGEDLEQVKMVALNAVKDIEHLSDEHELSFFYTEFGGSSINFVIRMWVDTAEQAIYKQVGSDAIIRIKNAFDKHNISIPFPIRTIDFGIKGGTTLSEMPLHVQHGSNGSRE
jgi:small conductance mechanosensitive channel